jgi:hypothetical protein
MFLHAGELQPGISVAARQFPTGFRKKKNPAEAGFFVER